VGKRVVRHGLTIERPPPATIPTKHLTTAFSCGVLSIKAEQKLLEKHASAPSAASSRSQQQIFNRFREEFNNERPHEALALATPAAVYQPSPRPFPTKLPPLEYPDHFETRYVSYSGGIRWKSAWVHVSITCAGQYLGLEAVDNQIWNVYFGPLRLGRLSEQHMRIQDEHGSLWRHNKKQKL